MKSLLAFTLLTFSFSSLADEMYMAKLETLNPHVNGTVAGSSTFYWKGDKVFSYNRFFAGAPEAWHMQNIYTGTKCPTLNHDTNIDGIIDIQEGSSAWGNILIPLDADINSQLGGHKTFPVADPYGSYFYEREGWYNNMMNDLRAVDPDPNDNIVKLGRNQKLILEGKVVVIFGITEQFAHLPDTVGSMEVYPAWKTLPVACGVFKRVYTE